MLRPPKRPLRITLLLWLVLIVTAWNLTRLLTAIDWKNTLEAYYYSPQEVLYVGVTGAIWTLVGAFVLWSYRHRGPYTRTVFLAAAGVYAAWYWLDRLLIQTTPQPNWLFAFAMTVLLLGFAGFVVLDPRNLSYFRRETHERKRENQSAT